MDEFAIIAEILAPLATCPGAFGLKDDAAVITPRPGFDLVVTTDQISEGTDFFKHDPAGSIAKKALLVNLSDLAAKGARPEYYLLTLSLPQSMTRDRAPSRVSPTRCSSSPDSSNEVIRAGDSRSGRKALKRKGFVASREVTGRYVSRPDWPPPWRATRSSNSVR